ncbi:ABC transporter ATP-binding protein [Jidongwangia harbinensis]|uniref:ABC transporter ATP-binding protein n=1 Tax=Jidongwangia harbinensis TaxID=2878561 RepID=UPI001CD952DB|nr:ABC transporter ATP-binding protein [Jidongwangia harbinensis]MCA2218285.1 ABC transporter ATP-binding protein/permease [Jidongwangia harbinensis]
MTPLPTATGRQGAAALARLVRAHPGAALTALAWTVASAALTVAVPLLLGRLVDAVRAGAGYPTGLVLGTGSAILAGAAGTALALRATERLGARVAADLREQVVARTLALPPAVLENAGRGDAASRVTEDLEDFVTAVPLVAEVLRAGVAIVLSTAGFLTLDWRLALAFAVVFPIYGLSLWVYLPRAARLYAAERRLAAERGRVLLESLHGRSTVHAYGMAALQTRRLAGASRDAVTVGLRAARGYLWFSKSMNAAEAAGLVAVLLTGYWLVRADLVSVGAVTAAALLFHRLFDPLATVLLAFDDVQRAHAALARAVGVLRVPRPAPGVTRRPAGTRSVSIRARNVRHAYGGGAEVLHDVDLSVPAGTSLALVGGSGAGKTTLANLIAGTFAATGGRITLTDADGAVDVAALDPAVLRDWIGVISQETAVFTGSLRDDLTLAAPGSDDEQIFAALRAARADAWVRALPHGLDTPVGPGGHELTAARVQQLALARLALRDPPAVVLDEATAEAGSAGARDLDEAAAALIDGRTAIVVAHRLTQARACDRIAVLAGGRIAETGTHDDLIARGGRYAALWAAWSSRAEVSAGPAAPSVDCPSGTASRTGHPTRPPR